MSLTTSGAPNLWDTPRGARPPPLGYVQSTNLGLLTTTGIPPFVPPDLPNPRGHRPRQDHRQSLNIGLLTTTGIQPFALLHWPNPRGYPPLLRHHAHSVDLPLVVPPLVIAPGYAPAPVGDRPPTAIADAASARWARQIADVVNNSLRGKNNVTLPITLTANAGTTTIVDARISVFSALLLMPLTANAAAEMGAGTIYVSSQSDETAVITHANNGQTDRQFRLLIIG